MDCDVCGHPKTEKIRGLFICQNCDDQDNEKISAEVTVTNAGITGMNVSQAGNFYRTAKGVMRDSGEFTQSKAEKEIRILAQRLKIPQSFADSACRAYKLARQYNFVQGRKAILVVAAALYLICRLRKQSFLLIDFADAINEDIFALGKVYRKLARELKAKVPSIDPSLFIKRFCAKLDFKEKTAEVALTAMKLMQGMNRDWITAGRRPTGLCGVAILISANYHGMKRSSQKVCEVVRVCNDTIRKRLEEFEKTSVASLTKEEFELIDLEDSNLEKADPPSFKPPCKDIKAIEALPPPFSIRCEEENNEDFSDIDDDELGEYILTEKESFLKSLMWHQLNYDWIEKQKMKEQAGVTLPQRRAPKRKDSKTEATSAVEALMNTRRIGNFANEEFLEHLLHSNDDIYIPPPIRRRSRSDYSNKS